MEDKIAEVVSGDQVITWLVIFFLVGYFVYREWPEFWRRVKKKAKDDDMDETISARLNRIEKEISEINDKLSRDYGRINVVERKQEADRKALKEIKIEQGIIMRALLGTLNGLQKLGANGETESAREELIAYLNKQAHDDTGGQAYE